MFTGIIEEIGTILKVEKGLRSAVLTIGAKFVLENLKNGDSINTNGACLTVTSFGKESFTVDAMSETMMLTNLQYLKPGSSVNLERAVKLNDRLNGHLVSGHIDGMGTISGMIKDDNAIRISIAAQPDVLRYIIKKGSIAIDGISLTVTEITSSGFGVSLIPYTIDDTTLAKKKTGDPVNLECDLIGKYVERLLIEKKQKKGSNIDENFLKEHGYL